MELNICENKLEIAAERLGMSGDDLRSQLESIDFQQLQGQLTKASFSDAGGNCSNINFDVGVFSIKGQVCFTPGSNWSLKIDLKLSIAGIELAHVEQTFNSRNSEICLRLDAVLVSVKVCLGARQYGSRVCFYTAGEICGPGGCTPWDENIVCF